jgi:hypothetical protein
MEPGLYTSGEWRHLFVNLSLTLSPVFPLMKDLHRNRLASRLTWLQPTPTLDKSGKNTGRNAIAAACGAAVSTGRWR